MNTNDATGFALAHVARTLMLVYRTHDRPALTAALQGFPDANRVWIEDAVCTLIGELLRQREENPSPEELEEGIPVRQLLAACRASAVAARGPATWVGVWRAFDNAQTAERYVCDHFASTLHNLYARPESIARRSSVGQRPEPAAQEICRAVLRIIYGFQDRAGTLRWESQSRSVRFDMPWLLIDRQILASIAERLGDRYPSTATRLADCRRELLAGLADLANAPGARQSALNLAMRPAGR
jgi:hypothetical protein